MKSSLHHTLGPCVRQSPLIHRMSIAARRGTATTILALALGLAQQLAAWTPGTYPPGSQGFTVNTASRNDVVSFWHGVYQSSEGYWNRHGWTGDYAAASPYDSGVGATAAVFVADTERRINFLRAITGLPATTALNTGSLVVIHPADANKPAISTTKEAAARRSAYMLIRTWGTFDSSGSHPGITGGNPFAALNHTPSATECVAWNNTAYHGNLKSNLALGYYGPGAIDAYAREEDLTGGSAAENSAVGHRRWLLHPPATNMASGDTPGSFDPATGARRLPSNALYVVQSAAEAATVAPRFTAYPSAGSFPAALNSIYWSVSHPGADFGAATVSMTTAAGAPVTTTVVFRNGPYGDPALVWQVPAAAAAKSVTADTSFNVTVSGVTGPGVPSSTQYTVTLINPNQINSNQALFGPGTPSTTAGAGYLFTPPERAEACEVNSFVASATAWTEGAEDNPAPEVTATTRGTYNFRSACSFSSYPPPYFGPITGAKSFHLTIPTQYDPLLNGVPAQSFELNRTLLPGPAGLLSFKYRRGLMGTSTALTVEASTDDGANWTPLGAAVSGLGGNSIDETATAVTRPLTGFTGPVRLRFRLAYTAAAGALLYAHEASGGIDWTTYPTGIILDDITTTDCRWLELKKTNPLGATTGSFALTATTAGVAALTNNLELRLRMRTKLGNRWMPYGPQKILVLASATPATAPVASPAAGSYPPGTAITLTSESGATIYYRINDGAELSGTSPVTGLVIPPSGPYTITAYAQKTSRSASSTTTIVFSTTPAASPFSTYMAAAFPGITNPAIVGPAADPDHDGDSNLLEFALGGNPDSPSQRVHLAALTTDGTSVRKLLLTLAVRVGTPTFTGSPSPAATVDGITYTVQGGLTPGAADGTVTPVAPVTGALPAVPSGYEYRTFKLDSSTGLPSRGFLRVKVVANP